MAKKHRGPINQYDTQDLLDDEFDIDEFVDTMSGHDYRRRARNRTGERRRIDRSRKERWPRE